EHGLRGELLLAARLQRALDLLQARGGLGDGLLGVPAVRLGVFAGGLQPGQRLAGRLQLLRGRAGAGLVVVEALLGLGRARGDAARAVLQLADAAGGLLVLALGLADVVLEALELRLALAHGLLEALERGARLRLASREVLDGGLQRGAARGERF